MLMPIDDGAPAAARRDEDAAFGVTAARARDAGCFFDFDGTLSRIVPDPASAVAVPGALPALSALSRVVRKVVIVSARPVEFLSERLAGLSNAALFGLYGLEWRVGDGPLETFPAAKPYEAVMAGLAGRAKEELPPSVLVEYKRIAIALHYRRDPSIRTTVDAWAESHASALGLAVQHGRMVTELKPAGARDKGAVVAEQLADLTCAWFFGDDLSDLRAFGTLEEKESIDPSFVGFTVAVSNPETGAALRSAANFVVAEPEAVPGFVTAMVKTIETSAG